MELFKKIDGSCPYCGGYIRVIEGLVEELEISKDGLDAIITAKDYRAAGYCLWCKKPLFVVPVNHDMGYIAYKFETAPYFAKKWESICHDNNIMRKNDVFYGDNTSAPFDGPYIDIKQKDLYRNSCDNQLDPFDKGHCIELEEIITK